MIRILFLHKLAATANKIINRLLTEERERIILDYSNQCKESISLDGYDYCMLDIGSLEAYQHAMSRRIPTICLYQSEDIVYLESYDIPEYMLILNYTEVNPSTLYTNLNVAKSLFSLNQQLVSKEEELVRLKHELAQISQRFNQFSNFVSHDIRPYVCRVLGLSELALIGKVSDADKITQLTLEAALKLDQMIKSINDYIFMQPEISSSNIEIVNLRKIVKEVVANLSPTSYEKGTIILNGIQPNMYLQLVPKALTISFTKLIKSCMCFAGKSFKIEITARMVGKQLWLSISDNGKGVATQRKRILPSENLEVSHYISYSLLIDMGVGFKVLSTTGTSTTYILKFPASTLASLKEDEDFDSQSYLSISKEIAQKQQIEN